MNPVTQSAQRSVSPSTSGAQAPAQKSTPAPAAAAPQKASVPGSRDEFITAKTESVSNKGARNQMTSGTITVNGHQYNYRSGGWDKGNLPNGDYTVSPHLWSRNTKGMVVDGVGFSFAISDKYDPRVGANRQLLRIHPDGGPAGTQGCIGIVGDGKVQKQFREDMRAELEKHGGSVKLHVE